MCENDDGVTALEYFLQSQEAQTQVIDYFDTVYACLFTSGLMCLCVQCDGSVGRRAAETAWLHLALMMSSWFLWDELT